MKVKEWEKFREEAIEAYDNLMPGDNQPRLGAEMDDLYEKLPIYRGDATSYRADAASKDFISSETVFLQEAIGKSLAFSIRDQFGLSNGLFNNFYMGRFSDGRPIFFIEEESGTGVRVYERMRLMIYLEPSRRNKKLTLYPRLSVFQERIRGRHLILKGVATIIVTFGIPVLPFGLLAHRLIAPLWRKYVWGYRGETLRDYYQFNPLNPPADDAKDNRMLMTGNNFKTWSSENLDDFLTALNLVYSHIGGLSGLNTQTQVDGHSTRRAPVTISPSDDDDI